MRRAISIVMIFAFGASLWAEQNVQKAKSDNPRPIVFSERISNDTRTESYTLLMADSYGDGWGGSSLDLSVNGVVVASGLTVTTSDNGGYEASYNFNVEIGDVVATTWTSVSSWDSEAAYAFYNTAGDLVALANSSTNWEVSFTVAPPAIGVWFSEYAEGTSNNKYLEIIFIENIKGKYETFSNINIRSYYSYHINDKIKLH